MGQLCADYLSHIQDPANPRRPSDQVNPPERLRAIGEASGDRSALSVMPYEVEDWLKSLKKKPGTLNRYRSTFSSVYRYAKEHHTFSRGAAAAPSQSLAPGLQTYGAGQQSRREPAEHAAIETLRSSWYVTLLLLLVQFCVTMTSVFVC